MNHNIIVIHGPNLNLLGIRNPKIYGNSSLEDINKMMHTKAKELNLNLHIFFSNYEGAIIDYLQKEAPKAEGVIFNLAAYTHTSIAILDSLLCFSIKKIEVHLSNIYARKESFRKISPYHNIADGIIIGFGAFGYVIALDAIHQLVKN